MSTNPTTDRAVKHLRTIADVIMADVIMAEAIHDEHRDEQNTPCSTRPQPSNRINPRRTTMYHVSNPNPQHHGETVMLSELECFAQEVCEYLLDQGHSLVDAVVLIRSIDDRDQLTDEFLSWLLGVPTPATDLDEFLDQCADQDRGSWCADCNATGVDHHHVCPARMRHECRNCGAEEYSVTTMDHSLGFELFRLCDACASSVVGIDL